MWNYRRSVLSRIEKVLTLRAGDGDRATAAAVSFFLPEEAEEVQFTTKEIKSNFSNYSAWHQRGYTIQKALARHGLQLQPSHAEGAPSVALPEAFATALYELVVEDLFLFTQSIYCDPSDQASFCYATFSLNLFRTFEAALRREYQQWQARPVEAESAEIDALLRAHAGDIMDCFVAGVVDVVTEQVELGEGASCSLALLFLLELLLRLGRGGAGDAEARCQRYAHTIHTHLVTGQEPPPASDRAAELRGTVAWLQQQLIAGDPLRRGMYEAITAGW
ncbi:hypothetical protein STCU_04879 [Strigomonas culicis]|uniref:Geranylgeranyl transferase type-2 subunit alpha n=1 Tax=Strigomonas culicis TaxID=28005 RepID=S9VP37_9TRYP|nr:hypothetical protein STCU_04879 [Strigomonas culicis]|eukprot:EPY28791.1 hypothetical protein STCU_04879 [Strigomonas culicis]